MKLFSKHGNKDPEKPLLHSAKSALKFAKCFMIVIFPELISK